MTTKEVDQIHKWCFLQPINVLEMTAEEKEKYVELLMIINQNNNGAIKGRMF